MHLGRPESHLSPRAVHPVAWRPTPMVPAALAGTRTRTLHATLHKRTIASPNLLLENTR